MSPPDHIDRLDVGGLIACAESMEASAGSQAVTAMYRNWLERTGNATNEQAFAIWFNLGVQYGRYGDTAKEVEAYQKALALRPNFHPAAINLGLVYERLGRRDAAVITWNAALQSDEARTALLNHRGRVLEDAKLYDAAYSTFEASLMTTPGQADVLHHLVGLRTRLCLWPIYAPGLPGVTETAMRAATRALTLLALADDLEVQTSANRAWIEEKIPPARERLCPSAPYRHAKIRIGYLSSDFCNHPIAFLLAELIERHDRDRFEIHGFCSTKDDGSAVRARLMRAFDVVADVRALSDEEAARLIRRHEIDILIDLNGLTLGTRLGALRWRPAPLQMTYLGYNGPVPLPELDYIIADDFVIPPALAPFHEPRPLYLPGCYQANDSIIEVTSPPSREALGLPKDAFVFCSFSNTYKITQEIFEAWLQILARVEGSVLWLFVDNEPARVNLARRAAEAGLAAERLIFAERVKPELYRGRLALADLFLDTFPYNSGTTASDALRVGLPLVTLSGTTFTARMAGSLLHALGADEAVAGTLADYVAIAVELATYPERMRSLRAKVTPARWHATLGDTGSFCRTYEAAVAASYGRAIYDRAVDEPAT